MSNKGPQVENSEQNADSKSLPRNYFRHWFIYFISFFKRFYLFICHPEIKSTGRGSGRGRGRSSLPAEQGARRGAWSHHPEIMTWAEIKSQMPNWLSYPGAPIFWMYHLTPCKVLLRNLPMGRLGGSVIKRLPSAQGMIPSPGIEPRIQLPAPLGACFLLSHSPCLCSLSCWLCLSLSNKLKKT